MGENFGTCLPTPPRACCRMTPIALQPLTCASGAKQIVREDGVCLLPTLRIIFRKAKLMFSRLRLTEEEKKHRRQMTNFAVKLMLLAVGVALLVQPVYYFAVISRPLSVSSWEFPLQMSVTVSALGLLALLLGVNHSEHCTPLGRIELVSASFDFPGSFFR